MTLTAPKIRGEIEVCRYTAKPRPKPFFKTVMDAKRIFDGATATITTKVVGTSVEIRSHHVTAIGQISEVATLDATSTLVMQTLTRTQCDSSGRTVREESVDFGSSAVLLPARSFPEVLLPFVLRGQRFDGTRDYVFSWTNDRFVARVYFEVAKRGVKLDVAAGSFRAHEVVMYPDLNDWVPLGSVLTTLAKPLLPKYTMWFEDEAPHRVVRFEGAYGPPGAPEVVLELQSTT
jgi:hypothetical protein